MDAAGFPNPAPINVWVSSGPHVLVGVAEIFTSITALKYAFTKVRARPSTAFYFILTDTPH